MNKFLRRQLEKREKKATKDIDARINRLATKLNRMRQDKNAGVEAQIADERLNSLLEKHGISMADFEDHGEVSDTYYLDNNVPNVPWCYFQHQEVVTVQLANYLGMQVQLMLEPSQKMLLLFKDTITNIKIFNEMVDETFQDLEAITTLYKRKPPNTMSMIFGGISYSGIIGNSTSIVTEQDEDSFKIGVFDFLFSKLQAMKEDAKIEQKPVASIEEKIIIAGELHYDPIVVNVVQEKPQDEPKQDVIKREPSKEVVPTDYEPTEEQPSRQAPPPPPQIRRIQIDPTMMRAGVQYAHTHQEKLKVLQD
jgi:hypothetical protein